MDNLLQNSTIINIIWVVCAVLAIYLLAVVWSHLALGRLFWQNIVDKNRVELPRLARLISVPGTGNGADESQTLVLARGETDLESDKSGLLSVIYPMSGRNGLHFVTARCTSCQLCSYVCPVEAISTHPAETGYTRSFDLITCIYCGLCEAACPTQAIKLTINQLPTQQAASGFNLSGFKVEGQVEKEICPECGRKIPHTDLLAERIYNLHLTAEDLPILSEQLNDGNVEILPVSHKLLEQGRGSVQPNPPCSTCQQTILELEEKICG